MIRGFKGISLVVFVLSMLSCAGIAMAGQDLSKFGVGVFIYENLEGYHLSGSMSGTSSSTALQTVFERIRVFDRVPLESNESVRILTEMTEGREVVLTPIRVWLTGGIIQPPTITFKDDAIKFQDLTWHVDQPACFSLSSESALEYVLVGSITGLVNEVKSVDSTGGRDLTTVQVAATLQLLEVSTSRAVWANSYRPKRAGFDPRTTFIDLLAELGDEVGKDIAAHFNH